VQRINKWKVPKHANGLKWFPLAVAGISRLAKQETIPEPFPKINPQGALSRLTSLCHSCPAPPNITKEQVSSQWCPDEGRQTYHFFNDSCGNCSSTHSCLHFRMWWFVPCFSPLTQKHYCFEETACRSLLFYWKFIWLDMSAWNWTNSRTGNGMSPKLNSFEKGWLRGHSESIRVRVYFTGLAKKGSKESGQKPGSIGSKWSDHLWLPPTEKCCGVSWSALCSVFLFASCWSIFWGRRFPHHFFLKCDGFKKDLFKCFLCFFNVFFKGGRYHFRTHFKTQKRNSCQIFWVLRPPLVDSILETIFGF